LGKRGGKGGREGGREEGVNYVCVLSDGVKALLKEEGREGGK